MLERGCKIFSCFLDVRKAFDTVWIDGLLFKLFIELEVGGRMWLTIKDRYTDVKAQVLYSGSLSRQLKVSQGTGQGRILAPFMYKVYINALLNNLTNHAYRFLSVGYVCLLPLLLMKFLCFLLSSRFSLYLCTYVTVTA